MKLLPRELEKLALHQAGFLAQKRLAAGLRLNYTEAVALIASQVLSLFSSVVIFVNQALLLYCASSGPHVFVVIPL